MQVILYYRCYAVRSRDSMRLKMVFRNTSAGRKKLLKFIRSEIENYNIEITDSMEQIEGRLIHTFPSAVNDCIRYGCLEVKEVY